ncbi:MAG: MAPEG family protein [Rhodospirillales bacterium]|nr:MAPEG family protein [Rhodospirillales bacterium]
MTIIISQNMTTIIFKTEGEKPIMTITAPMFSVTPLYVALNVLLLIVLSFRVVHFRIENQVSLGDGGVMDLQRSIRAHGNLAEYAPFALLLMALLEFNGLPVWQLHLLGGVFSAARVAHAYGVLDARRAPRSMGALVSMVVLMILTGLAIVQVAL